jgi:hypothetical protein
VPDNPAKDALYELLDYFEQVETQSAALLACLRDNGIVTDEKLAPYLAKAADATEVKSRAMHARFDYLFNTDQTTKPATEANPTPPKERPTQPEGEAAVEQKQEQNQEHNNEKPKKEQDEEAA